MFDPRRMTSRVWVLIGVMLIPLAVRVFADDAGQTEPVVPLLPAPTEEAVDPLAGWTGQLTLAPIFDESRQVTIRLPEEPQILTEGIPTDYDGRVWHYYLPESGVRINVDFLRYPEDLVEQPFDFFKRTTPFAEDAIALVNDPAVLEVEAPVEFDGETLRGLFRAWPAVGYVVFVSAALPDTEDLALREAYWASLRRAEEPLAPLAE